MKICTMWWHIHLILLVMQLYSTLPLEEFEILPLKKACDASLALNIGSILFKWSDSSPVTLKININNHNLSDNTVSGQQRTYH